MDIKRETREAFLVIMWLIIGLIIGFACGYIYGSVETFATTSLAILRVLL